MLLVNGCSGIATGFSTEIPMHTPRVIMKAVRQFVETSTMGDDGEVDDFDPGFVGFTGIYEGGAFKCPAEIGGTKISVNEIPPSFSFDTWEEKMKATKGLNIVRNTCTETTADFILEMDEEPLDEDALMKLLKLTQKISTNNMWAFDSKKRLKKYTSTKALLIEWCHFRLTKYAERLTHLRERAAFDRDVANAKAAFILMVAKRQVDLYKQTPPQFEALCAQQGWIKVNESWGYLTELAIKNLTMERANTLEAEAERCSLKLMELNARQAEDLWTADLDALEKFL